MKTVYIDKNDDLVAMVEPRMNASIMAVDTEFVRKNTYYSKLGLVQLAFEDCVYVIDPLTCSIDNIEPLLFNDQILKVFHSCRQDLEIFFHHFKKLPVSIFDLQIAANKEDLYRQASLDQLSMHFLNLPLDKTLQDADWLFRPLSTQMIDYAAQDAQTIYALYNYLKHCDHQPEMEDILMMVKNYDPAEKVCQRALHNIKNKNQLNDMHKLIRWREKHAKRIDVPREHFLSYTMMENLIKEIPITKVKFKSMMYVNKPRDLVARKKEYRELLWCFLRDLPTSTS
ncbi:MAG: Ribonuclease D [Holosporales bacterium]